MIGKPYRSYVAIGDSLSEGLGDFTFQHGRIHNGWTDRLAGILSQEAIEKGYEFHYANLALRGTGLEKIMTLQLHKALELQPDLVTVMAGSNNLTCHESKIPQLQQVFRHGLQELLAAGCDVVVANTINPLHLKVFKPLRKKAERFSSMIDQTASELGLPVLDVFGIQSFEDLMFWAEDMVHFSGHGHIVVANQAAELLDLKYRYPEISEQELTPISRGLVETVSWVARDVIPFFKRRIQGRTAGDGMDPKHLTLEKFEPKQDHPHWQLLSA